MNALRSYVLLLTSVLLLTATAGAQEQKTESQEHKKTYNTALTAAKAKDYATARVKFAESANAAEAASDAQTARQARYMAAQMDYRLGNAALRADETSTALQHYENGVAIFPEYIKNHYHQGLALKRLGRMEEALEAWKGILEGSQDRKTSLAAAGAIRDHFYYQASTAVSKSSPTPSDGDRALAALDRSVEYVEPDSKYYYYVSVAQLAKGNNEACISAADQALALHRGSRADAAAIHFTKGEALLRNGDAEGAKAAFQNALYGSYKPSAEHYLSTL